MKSARAALGVGAAAVVLAGCGVSPQPSDGVQPTPEFTVEAIMPMPTDVLTLDLVDAWRRAPIDLDASHVAIVSDACSLAARAQLGDDDADLPTALVDARGGGVATAILADDLAAIQCMVHFDESALIATVDSVARLSMTAAEAVEGSDLSVASAVHVANGGSGRMVAVGRVGPDAPSMRVELRDGSAVIGAVAEGWWAAWWPGATPAKGYSAIDAQGRVTAPNG
jgi:hypothetical protein